MPQAYGTILSSTPDSITRLVIIDGGVTLQTLTIAQEVTLDPGEVAHMVWLVGQEPARPFAPRVPRFGNRIVPGAVCACDGQAGIHVATGACSPFLREEG